MVTNHTANRLHMKQIKLLRSAKDLAAKWVASHHPDQYDPEIPIYVDAFESVVINNLIDQELARQNAIMVKPVLIRYADTVSGRIPVMFRVRGHLETKIRHNHALDHHGLHRHWLEVASDSGCWFCLSDEDTVRLYEALLGGGCLSSILK